MWTLNEAQCMGKVTQRRYNNVPLHNNYGATQVGQLERQQTSNWCGLLEQGCVLT